MALLYFCFSFFVKKLKHLLLFSLPFLLLIGLSLLLSKSLIGVVLLYLFIIPFSIFTGRISKKNKLFIIPFLALIIVFFNYPIIENFNSFFANKNARKYEPVPSLKLFNTNNESIRIDTIKDKIIILNFWTTNCGVCFKEFPKYEKSYLKYKKNPNLEFYGVHIPTSKDTLTNTKKLVESLAYKFPILYATSNRIPKKLNFNTYPHLIIIKNSKVRFSGQLITSEKVIYHLNYEINQLLTNE